MTEDRKRLVMGVHSYDQFVFVIADDNPMQAPRGDHFGMAVDSLEELKEVLRRAEAFAATDGRAEVMDYEVEDFGVLKLHSFYVRYLLPLMVEVQYFELARLSRRAAGQRTGTSPPVAAAQLTAAAVPARR